MGRPSIINYRLIKDVCSKLERGMSVQTAIQKAGIARASYFRWDCNVRQDCGTKWECRFINAIKLILGRKKLRNENAMFQHMDAKWRSAAWWLERKYPDEYGRRRTRPLPDPDSPVSDPWPQRLRSEVVPPAGKTGVRSIVRVPTQVSNKQVARGGGYRNTGTPKLTKRLREHFCSVLEESGSIDTARMLTGINLGRYKRMVLEVGEGGGALCERRFITEVYRAEGKVKMMVEAKLSMHFEKNWKVLAWWLERKYSDEYGRRRPHPLPDPDVSGRVRKGARLLVGLGEEERNGLTQQQRIVEDYYQDAAGQTVITVERISADPSDKARDYPFGSWDPLHLNALGHNPPRFKGVVWEHERLI